MAGFGFGFGSVASVHPFTPPQTTFLLGQVQPAAAWNGIAGSGFTQTPVDPVRTVAKPVCRLLVPPRQRFTDTLLVGVIAGANNGGSLLDNMGLEYVRLHFEGATYDIMEPSFQTFADANGNPVTYHGWWCRLKKPSGRSGEAHVYFEAVPKNPAFQKRVIGPYSFWPKDTLYDREIEIAATPVEIAGVRYKTIAGMLTFINNKGYSHVRARFSEAGTYEVTVGGGVVPGYIVFEADPGVAVTLKGPDNPTFEDATGKGRLNYSTYSCFRGNGVTIDFKDQVELYASGTGGAWPWFDGCIITDSRGRDVPWRGRPKAGLLGWAIRGNPWFTECSISNLYNCPDKAELVRGCTLHAMYNDLFNDAPCVVGNRVTELDSSFFNNQRAAMVVTYTGPEATATIQRTSAAGGVRIIWGANQATLTISSTQAAYVANTNYTVRNVVDFINSYAAQGWSATLLDDTFFASVLCLNGTKGAGFAAMNVKNTPLTLYTAFDIHSDFYQRASTGTLENVAIANNHAQQVVSQDIFLVGNVNDALVCNNAFHNKTGFAASTGLRSQLNNTHQHVVVVHNTLASQDIAMRSDPPQTYNPDSHSLVANNSLYRLVWSGPVDADLQIRNNHLQAGAAGTGTPGESIGGDMASLFVDAPSGNFSPLGALAANTRTPVLRWDIDGAARGSIAPVGAVAG